MILSNIVNIALATIVIVKKALSLSTTIQTSYYRLQLVSHHVSTEQSLTGHVYVLHGKWPMTDRSNAHKVEGNHLQN